MKFFDTLYRRLSWCRPPIPSVITILLILWLTLAPKPVGEMDVPLFPGIDKVVHACMFGFLTAVMWVDCGRRNRQWKFPSLRSTAILDSASMALGIAIEFMQHSMGLGRSLEWADMAADAAGCLCAVAMIVIARKHINDF